MARGGWLNSHDFVFCLPPTPVVACAAVKLLLFFCVAFQMLLAGFLGTQATLLACVTLLAMIDLMFGRLRAAG